MTAFRWTLIILGGTLIAVYLWLFSVDVFYDSGNYTTDSVFYIDTARNLAEWHGYVTRIVPLHEAIAENVTPPVPMTTWPPVYPLVIALLSVGGMDASAAALAVPLIALGLCLVFAFLLVNHAYGPSAGILAASCLVALSPARIIASHAWSESLGMAFTLAALWLLLGARRRHVTALWAAAGLLTGLAFATRYSLAPLFIVGLAACWQGRTRRTAWAATAYAAGAAMFAAPVVIRNMALTGGLGGPGAWHELPGLAHHLHLTGITFQRVAAETPFLVAAIFAIMIGLAVIQFMGRRKQPVDQEPLRDGAFLTITVGFGLIYFLFLISSALRYVIEPLSERLLAPVFVMIVLVAVGLWIRATRWRGIVTGVFAVLVAGTLTAGEYYSLQPVLAINPPPVSDFDTKIRRSAALTWLHDNIADTALVVTVDEYEGPLYLGPVDTVMLYTFLPPDMQPDYDALMNYVDGPARPYNQILLHVPDKPLFSAVEWPHESPFVDNLRAGNFGVYPRLEQVFKADGDTIFRIQKRDK